MVVTAAVALAQVRQLKAEVRVARRAEKTHAQTLAAAEANATPGGGVEGGEGGAAVAALMEEKLELQDRVYDLEVRLGPAASGACRRTCPLAGQPSGRRRQLETGAARAARLFFQLINC